MASVSVVLVMMTMAAPLAAASAVSAGSGGVTPLGFLPTPPDLADQNVLYDGMVDAESQRLFEIYSNQDFESRIAEYDLRPAIPSLIRTAPYPRISTQAGSPNMRALASARRLMFTVEYEDHGGTCPRCSLIRRFDLRSLRFQGPDWNLGLIVPNFLALGVSYSQRDDVLYVVGTIIGFVQRDSSLYAAPPPTYPVEVMALDAHTGSMLWIRSIRHCQTPMARFGSGAPIYASAIQPALYVPCMRPDSGKGAVVGFPGQSGVVKLHLSPNTTTTTAPDLREEFFPGAGTYTRSSPQAVCSFDPGTDRVFMLSISRNTPGVWVFDGLLSAWVGFVPAHDRTAQTMGTDPSTGHVFVHSGLTEKLVVSDGRRTPVPQGEEFDVGYRVRNVSFLAVDPTQHRAFVPVFEDAPVRVAGLLVVRDDTPINEDPSPGDYDVLTTNIAEGPHTVAMFAGSVNGFGVRATIVGGTGGLDGPYRQAAPQAFGSLAGLPLPAVSPSDRGLFGGRVGLLDLRNVGAAASAQAAAPDSVTEDDHRTKQADVGKVGDLDDPEGSGDPLGARATDAVGWRWPAAACLDGGGAEATGGGASPVGSTAIECDLAEGSAAASASIGQLELPTFGVGVAHSSFESTASRDPVDGIVTRTLARSRGVHITVPGSGEVRIGEVSALAETRAHGRPGSSRARWTTVIADVFVTDGQGKKVFQCGATCDAAEVAAAVNDIAALKLRISVPEAEVVQTRGGAFASVQKTRRDSAEDFTMKNDDSKAAQAMQLVVYNDQGDKSKLVLDLAAIQASSMYTISVLEQASSLSGRLGTPPSGLIYPAPPNLGGETVDPPAVVGGLVPRVISSALLLVRSPRDAFLMSIVLLLFAAALSSATRRRAFVRLLEGEC